MTRILYIADPNSIHDMKWINWFSDKPEFQTFILCREHHYKREFENIEGFLGTIPDYSVFRFWKNKKAKKILNSAFQENKIDLVHIFYAEPNLLQAHLIQLPVVLTCRGSDVLVGFKAFIEKNSKLTKKLIKAYQASFNKVQAVITTSSGQKDYLEKHFKLSTEIQVIRTGLDISKLKNVEKEKLIFFPRNMQPLYHHELALEVISGLSQDIRENYEFLFVNRNSENRDYVNQIEDLIKVTGVSNIEFVDSLQGDAYYETLAKAELVVMTPKSDGAPVSAMETIASGTKLILPDLGYDKDLFEKAIYYNAGDSDALEKAIILALSKESEQSDSSYLKKVDRNEEMSKVHDIYQSVLRT